MLSREKKCSEVIHITRRRFYCMCGKHLMKFAILSEGFEVMSTKINVLEIRQKYGSEAS